MDPTTAKDWFDLVHAKLLAGSNERAADTCAQALRAFPDDPNLLCLSARIAIALGLLGEARARAERALQLAPEFASAIETMGDVLLVEGASERAVELYERAQRAAPQHPALAAKLARARDEARSRTARIGRRRQNERYDDELRRAAELERDGEHAAAEDIYRSILRADPDHVEAIRLLAAVATRHRRYRDAEILLRRAVELAPGYARAWSDLSSVLCEQEKLDDAIASGKKVTSLAPEIAESWVALANACARAGMAEKAIAHYRKAAELRPGHAGAYSGLAHQLKTIGRQDEAIAAHRACIASNPLNPEPWWSLANLKTFRFDDEDLVAMESLLERENLDDAGVQQVCNALGLAWESRGEYDRAFGYFERCNRSRRQNENYDPVETEMTTDLLIEVFDREFMDSHRGHGLDDPSPIFVVGLPRSGSTLIEQILASHSQVEGTHELSDLAWVVRAETPRDGESRRFPKSVMNFGREDWAGLGRHYLERTMKFRGGAPRFVDKNPNNFIYVGLLALILPNASIVNARRHPLDSCLGTWKQLFAAGQPFSYDLTEVGEYYLQYRRLMDHWHTLLPGKVLDVHYEDVVTDLETQVRRLLEHCGLPYEEACLSFHETDRAVRTASSEQVRKPIYTTSLNLWQRYEAHLGELKDVLRPLMVE